MLCKLVTEKVILGLPQSIIWGNTLDEWVILAVNNFLGIVGEQWEWYPHQRSNSLPHRPLEIHTTLYHGHPAPMSADEPILVVKIPGGAETFKTVIHEMTPGTDFKLVNLFHPDNANLTHKDLNTSIVEPTNGWNIHLVSYDTLTSRAKTLSNGRLSHCVWSVGICDQSDRYMKENSVGWRIAKNVTIGFKLQFTATPGFHSVHDWCYQTMWLFSCAPEDPEDETVVEMHGADALYSPVKSLRHAIRPQDQDAQQDASHCMIQMVKLWTIRRWSESTLANGKPLVWILKENAHSVEREWNEHEQAKLKALVERYTSWGASGVWRVHRWQLACSSVLLGDTEDWNDVSERWLDE